MSDTEQRIARALSGESPITERLIERATEVGTVELRGEWPGALVLAFPEVVVDEYILVTREPDGEQGA